MDQLPPRLVLTGATGWIGTAFLAALARDRGPEWTRTVTLFGSSQRALVAPDGAELMVRVLDQLTGADVADADVVHLAYLTKDKVQTLGIDTFMSTNLAIDARVLAACQAGRPRALFVASSGAARQAETGRGREPYGLSKLMQEDRFLAFGASAGVPVLVGRIFSLAGPFINKLQSYALSSMLGQALQEGAVRITATTPVYRAYLHVEDVCALVLRSFQARLSLDGAADLSGSHVVEMEDVAREALRAVGRPHGEILRAAVDWTRPSLYFGDPTSARTLALRLGVRLRSLAEQVDDTAADLRARSV